MNEKNRNDDIDELLGKKYNKSKVREEESDMLLSKQEDKEARKLPHIDSDKWITTGEAARLLGVSSINTVKRWIEEGKLKARRPGNWIQISLASVEKLLKKGDKEVDNQKRFEELLHELDDLGGELTKEILEDLSMKKLGKLPWEKRSDGKEEN